MKKRTLSVSALIGVGALALTGCVATAEDVAGESSNSDDSKGTIKIAEFSGWEEGIATTELWRVILEDAGYTVEVDAVDAGTVFQGLSDGDYDVTTDVWEPTTHAEYLDTYGDDIEKVGTWNEDSKLTVAVNADAPIDSLEELADHADEFGNTIVGIEPGAGLTSALTNSVIPAYGLEGMNFQTSSTPAMLAELQAAENAGENVVVTLWEPHWAYSAYDIKNLEDPEGALGAAESLNVYSREGFADDFSEVEGWLADFTMDTELLAGLEDLMFNQNADATDWEPIVREWIADNQDYVDGLTA